MPANLLEIVKVVKIHNGSGAGTTLVTSGSAVDTAGYDGVMIVADLAAVVDNCVLTLTPLTVATNTTSGGTAVSNATTAAFTAATSSNAQLVCDVYKPAARYVYATLARTTQNATVNSITAFLYRARSMPVTQPSTVVATKIGGSI